MSNESFGFTPAEPTALERAAAKKLAEDAELAATYPNGTGDEEQMDLYTPLPTDDPTMIEVRQAVFDKLVESNGDRGETITRYVNNNRVAVSHRKRKLPEEEGLAFVFEPFKFPAVTESLVDWPSWGNQFKTDPRLPESSGPLTSFMFGCSRRP